MRKDNNVEDGAQVGIMSDDVHRILGLPEFRQHSPNEIIILQDLKLSGDLIDTISQLSVRPPGLQKLINSVEDYFRWFTIDTQTCLEGAKTHELLSDSLHGQCWIDGLQHQVKMKRKAIPEIDAFLHTLDVNNHESGHSNEGSDGVEFMTSYLRSITEILMRQESDNEEITIDDQYFLNQVNMHLVNNNVDHAYLIVD